MPDSTEVSRNRSFLGQLAPSNSHMTRKMMKKVGKWSQKPWKEAHKVLGARIASFGACLSAAKDVPLYALKGVTKGATDLCDGHPVKAIKSFAKNELNAVRSIALSVALFTMGVLGIVFGSLVLRYEHPGSKLEDRSPEAELARTNAARVAGEVQHRQELNRVVESHNKYKETLHNQIDSLSELQSTISEDINRLQTEYDKSKRDYEAALVSQKDQVENLQGNLLGKEEELRRLNRLNQQLQQQMTILNQQATHKETEMERRHIQEMNELRRQLHRTTTDPRVPTRPNVKLSDPERTETAKIRNEITTTEFDHADCLDKMVDALRKAVLSYDNLSGREREIFSQAALDLAKVGIKSRAMAADLEALPSNATPAEIFNCLLVHKTYLESYNELIKVYNSLKTIVDIHSKVEGSGPGSLEAFFNAMGTPKTNRQDPETPETLIAAGINHLLIKIFQRPSKFELFEGNLRDVRKNQPLITVEKNSSQNYVSILAKFYSGMTAATAEYEDNRKGIDQALSIFTAACKYDANNNLSFTPTIRTAVEESRELDIAILADIDRAIPDSYRQHKKTLANFEAFKNEIVTEALIHSVEKYGRKEASAEETLGLILTFVNLKKGAWPNRKEKAAIQTLLSHCKELNLRNVEDYFNNTNHKHKVITQQLVVDMMVQLLDKTVSEVQEIDKNATKLMEHQVSEIRRFVAEKSGVTAGTEQFPDEDDAEMERARLQAEIDFARNEIERIKQSIPQGIEKAREIQSRLDVNAGLISSVGSWGTTRQYNQAISKLNKLAGSVGSREAGSRVEGPSRSRIQRGSVNRGL